MKRLAALAALMLYGAASAAERCPAQVRVSLPNFEIAPYVLGTDKVENPPGLLIEWTRNALMLAGCRPHIVIKRRPPNRQMAELEQGLLDVLPGFGYAANPDSHLLFPMKDGLPDPERAVMSDAVSLYARAGDQGVHWDGRTLRSVNPRVGSSTGGAGTAVMARAHGWEIESAPTPQADLRKLIAGRIDVIVEPDVVLERYLVGADGAAVRKLTPPARLTLRYAPVSKRFGQAHPEFTERFWLELCKQSQAEVPGRSCR